MFAPIDDGGAPNLAGQPVQLFLGEMLACSVNRKRHRVGLAPNQKFSVVLHTSARHSELIS